MSKNYKLLQSYLNKNKIKKKPIKAQEEDELEIPLESLLNMQKGSDSSQ